MVPWILPGKAKARHGEPQGTTFSIYLAEVDRYTKKIHNVLSRALSVLFGKNRNYFISCVRSPMWKFGLNSNMVPIYSIDVLGLLTDGSPAHLPSLTPKLGLCICFPLCYLKNAGVLKRIYNFRKSYPRPAFKKAFHTNTPKSNLII